MDNSEDRTQELSASASDSATQNPADATETKGASRGRRQFFAGIASAVGAGALLAGTEHQSSSKKAEASAAEIRSRIVTRIQEDLKKSNIDLMHGYDKPCSGGTHGKYASM